MNTERFEKDGQTIWERGDVVSGCIKTTSEAFDPETGFVAETKHMNWIKGKSEDIVERTITGVTKMIQDGELVPYRVFTEEPAYDGHEEDINPTTNAKLGRYSQSRLGTPAKALEMDRKFITVEAKAPVNNTPIHTEA